MLGKLDDNDRYFDRLYELFNYNRRWQCVTGGIEIGVPQGAYSNAFGFSEVNLGNVVYSTSGNKVFRFTVTGKNSAGSGYATAIDYVMLTRQ